MTVRGGCSVKQTPTITAPGRALLPERTIGKKKGTWHTLDHVIVSGGLLSNAMPYLLETSIEIFHNEELVDQEGHPNAFEWIDDQASGLSDHLPVVGSLVVEPEEFL